VRCDACSERYRAAALLVIVAHLSGNWLLRAQPKPVDSSSQAIQTFPLPEPQADRVAIDERRKVLRAEILVTPSVTVRFYEEPTSETVYNSSITVEKGGSVSTYRIGDLIKHQALRLVHTGLVQAGDSGMLVCEYEGGAVGAREGFAVLRYSQIGFTLHSLPLTEFGKIVVSKGNPEWAEIWSALPDNAASTADERYYATRSCRWQPNGYVCGSPKRQPRRFAPGAINDPGIEIRP
jgi:hypothetical protein